MAITTTIAAENGGPTITCQAWQGFIGVRQKVADVYHRLGQTGAGVQSLGFRAKPSRCTAIVLCADVATAMTVYSQLNGLRAGYVTVTDGFGYSNRCVVHDADARVVAGSHAYAGTLYPYRVEADLTLEYVGTP